MFYELIIIGGGPAGVAAGVYAARKKIKTLLIAKEFGGQSMVSADVQNWIGTKSISGFELAQMLEGHVRAQEDIEVLSDELVTTISSDTAKFVVGTEGGKQFESKTLLLTSGSRRRKLGIPGEKEFDGRGVVYCSTCDAPIFKGKEVAVIGGGNAGLEAARDLLPYASKIYLLHRGDTLKGDPLTQEKITADSKVSVILNAQTKEIFGTAFVEGIRYIDSVSGEQRELKLDGIFVEIGSLPNSDFVKNLAALNERGEVIVDHKTQRASLLGVWAAGDVTDVLYKQNNISAGDAVKAVLNIYDYLHSGK
ncbi:MAG: hypothetical protein A3I31_01175 [Candidatus Colwellbacteria bacterium RIFCSPLOWO2_02_FULL_44_20b]|uniref:FAD/NAD(P)-binding domain-containing protein n=1 Tax=Candidatus Colwellbacteria bacterium RIFCSPLOWO2_02_FULL_44_20b TaxID=1797691 RepID=A0A1G1Z4P5_9BACT|nr:MAG: hypothetical protein A3I31_01175 [Candidatus Colwellbacteria bacterium RIFCSPLOWO2_02_FULL_44_20b]